MEVGNIIKGHVNELLGLNKDISKERLKICKQCPLYLEDYGGQCNPRLYLNPETGEVTETQIINFISKNVVESTDKSKGD